MTLKERLLETIASLSDDYVEETFQFVQALQAPIRKVSGVCGGAARIRDTRIPVWTLVAYRNQGANAAELLENYPGLTLKDLQAAWDYYDNNQTEIDRSIISTSPIVLPRKHRSNKSPIVLNSHCEGRSMNLE